MERMIAFVALGAAGLTACSSGHPNPHAPALPPCALQHSYITTPRTAPVNTGALTRGGTLPATVRSAFRTPSDTTLFPIGRSGDVYFRSDNTAGRIDAD